VAPKLFYVYRLPHSEMSLEEMEVTHKYMVLSDSYSIGKLTQRMNVCSNDEYNRHLFKNNNAMKYFLMKLDQFHIIWYLGDEFTHG